MLCVAPDFFRRASSRTFFMDGKRRSLTEQFNFCRVSAGPDDIEGLKSEVQRSQSLSSRLRLRPVDAGTARTESDGCSPESSSQQSTPIVRKGGSMSDAWSSLSLTGSPAGTPTDGGMHLSDTSGGGQTDTASRAKTEQPDLSALLRDRKDQMVICRDLDKLPHNVQVGPRSAANL